MRRFPLPGEICPRLGPGDYGQDKNGNWQVRPPGKNRHGGTIGPHTGHTITEHEDGTITVSPSILFRGDNQPYFHGYLEKGVWREA